MSKWPWSDLVSYVMHMHPTQNCRILELGCGAGANIPFFLDLNVDYCAIEGSLAAVTMLRKKFPNLKDKIIIGDFTKNIPFQGYFDIVIDRASLTHNTTSAIKNSLKIISKRLKPGGKFIGIDWFSTSHPDYSYGKFCKDKYTKTGYTEGVFANIGRVHFSDKGHLLKLFSKFKIIIMEHKLIIKEIPKKELLRASWNFVAEKPNRYKEPLLNKGREI